MYIVDLNYMCMCLRKRVSISETKTKTDNQIDRVNGMVISKFKNNVYKISSNEYLTITFTFG